MLMILLLQFNSFYSSFLILFAVVMSTAGVLIGLMLTGQAFGIVMTGVGFPFVFRRNGLKTLAL